jgi:periplasmic protein TonB
MTFAPTLHSAPRAAAQPAMSSAIPLAATVGIGTSQFEARRRLLAGCLLGSVALHALVFLLLPGWMRPTVTLPVPVLDVVMVAAEPQAASDRLPQAPAAAVPQRRPELLRPTPREPSRVVTEAPAAPAQPSPAALPTLAMPVETQRPAAESKLTSPSAPVPARVETASTPPVFNAAYLRNPPPRYPPAARRSGEEGTVTLKVLVSAEGAPVRVELDQSSGSAPLDSAALDAVKGWRFVPARRGAQNVEGWVRVPVVFRLES